MIDNKIFYDNLIAVIVTHFPSDIVFENIKKLEEECKEILIVDNGSNGESLEIIKKLEQREKISVYYCKENLGIAAALNIGINYAIEQQVEWLLTFDQDSVIITENYALTLLETVKKDFGLEKVAVIGGNYPKPFDSMFPNSERYPPCTGKISSREVNTVITSGNLLIVKEIKKSKVLFNEKLFIDYVDYDFCLSLKQKGYRVIQVLDCKFEHTIGNPYFKTLNGNRIFIHNHNHIRKYYLMRNSLVVHKKFSFNHEWVLWSKKFIFSQIKYTILFERKKTKKIFAIILGFIDGKRNKLGKYPYKFL